MARQSKVPSGFAFDQREDRIRQSLIVRVAGLGGINFLSGCAFLTAPSDIALCLAACVFCLLIAGSAHFFGALDFSAHSFLFITFVTLAVLVLRTGGINSPVIVWMPVIPVAALLLVNLRWSLAWLGIAIVHHMGQYSAVRYFWVSAEVGAATMSPANTLWTKLSLALALMLALHWYEMKYRAKNVRLAARTQALGELQDSMQTTRTQMDVFVSALEIQLRVPLQRIALMAPIAQSDMPAVPEGQSDVRSLVQASLQLRDLVDELGDLARLESGQLALHQGVFTIGQAVDTAVASFASRNTRCKVAMDWESEYQSDAKVVGDEARITRVIAGLLLRSAHDEYATHLRVHAAYTGAMLALDIPQTKVVAQHLETDATGLQATAMQRAIQPLEAVALQTQDLHERLAALAGGRFAYVRASAGWVLRLEWPLSPVNGAGMANPSAAHAKRQSLRVMVVGGQSAQQFEMQHKLGQLFDTCACSLADSGETALVQLEFGHFDLVLVELTLPGMDGLEMTRRIRAHAKSQVRDVAIVGMSNLHQPGQRQHCLAVGMQWVLFRPWSQDTLLRVLTAQLA